MIQIAEKAVFSRNIFSTLLVLTGKTMATACVWVWCLSDPERLSVATWESKSVNGWSAATSNQ